MKYKITKESIQFEGRTLFRIEKRNGEKGGFVEDEENLSQKGKCWIHDDAKVMDQARLIDNGEVFNRAILKGHALVHDDARIFGDAKICSYSTIYGKARVYDNVIVKYHARVEEYAVLEESCIVEGHASVCGYANIRGRAKISGFAVVNGSSLVRDDSLVFGNALIKNKSRVRHDAKVYGSAILKCGKMDVDIFEDIKKYIMCSLDVLPINDYYYLFKKVKRVKKGVYESLYDSKFIYKDGEVAVAEDPDEDVRIDCGSGLHVSTATYWEYGETTIAVKVHVNDVITCQRGKLRVRSLFVLGEV